MSVRVTLKRPHWHAGEFFPQGASLRVSESDADWLIAQGIASRAAHASRAARDAVKPSHQPEN